MINLNPQPNYPVEDVPGPTLHGSHFLSAASHQALEHAQADQRALAFAITAQHEQVEERQARRQAILQGLRQHARAEAERQVELDAASETVRNLQLQIESEKPSLRDGVIGFGAVVGGLGTVAHTMVSEGYRPMAYVAVVGLGALAGREWAQIESRTRRAPLVASLAAAQRDVRLRTIPCPGPTGSFNRCESAPEPARGTLLSLLTRSRSSGHDQVARPTDYLALLLRVTP